MSASNEIEPTTDGMFAELSDREILESIYASQVRVEMMVSQTIANLAPTVEAFSKGGVMGLMGMMGKR